MHEKIETIDFLEYKGQPLRFRLLLERDAELEVVDIEPLWTPGQLQWDEDAMFTYFEERVANDPMYQDWYDVQEGIAPEDDE